MLAQILIEPLPDGHRIIADTGAAYLVSQS
jgi:hypothetical protein